MKEVTIKRFEKGDFIKGKKGNGYVITNENLVRGVVTGVDDDTMTVKGLEFADGLKRRTEYRVRNSTEYFELLPKANNKADENTVLNIKVTAVEGNEQVCAMLRVKDRMYTAYAVCSPDDEFDLRMGAAIAIGRAFDLMDKKAEEPKKPEGLVKIGDLVRVLSCAVSGGLKDGDLTEVMGIGQHGSGDKPYIYVASKTKSCYDGDDCVVPGRRALKQPFTCLGPGDYEILPEQPVRPGKVSK